MEHRPHDEACVGQGARLSSSSGAGVERSIPMHRLRAYPQVKERRRCRQLRVTLVKPGWLGVGGKHVMMRNFVDDLAVVELDSKKTIIAVTSPALRSSGRMGRQVIDGPASQTYSHPPDPAHAPRA
jgi:hypothetical protein